MRLVLATANPDKAAELAAILEEELGDLIELVPRPGGVDAVEETGDSLEDNARLKAVALVAATGEAAVADDTGLEVVALVELPAFGRPVSRARTPPTPTTWRSFSPLSRAKLTDRRVFERSWFVDFPMAARLSARGSLTVRSPASRVGQEASATTPSLRRKVELGGPLEK